MSQRLPYHCPNCVLRDLGPRGLGETILERCAECHEQRELNKLAVLYVLAGACLFGSFVWAAL